VLGHYSLHEGIAGQSPLQYSMLDLEFAELSDTGKLREHNEDFLGHITPDTPELARNLGWLFVLADGVGGHEKGEVASRTAVESMLAEFRSARAGDAHSALLPKLVQAANARVLEAGMGASPGGSNMATTLVSCALRFDRVVVAHVGDSRCYLIRRGQASVLTRDHTVAGEQVRLGLLSAGEAATSANRHLLSRSLGTEMIVNVECNEHQVVVGDVLVLCSDGLHGAVGSSEIAAIAAGQQDLHAAAHRLIEMRVGMYRGRPYRLR
jgi:serine/threonine protein phosphatase PrpC